MLKEKITNQKICLFYVSDYHFEMISLPYIRNKIKENNDVIILTENNLEDTVKKVLENVDISEKEKENILELGWNNEINKLEKLKNKDGEKIIFVKGNKEYIKSVNKNIESIFNNSNGKIKIIDCYDINEIGAKSKEITKKYKNILITSGIKSL